MNEATYLHLGYADPDTPVFRKVGAGRPGVIVADPLEEISTDAVHRASEALPAAGADLIAPGRPSPPTPTW